MQVLQNNNLLVISWDGKSKPLNFINIDAQPLFDLLIFDYSGNAACPTDFGWPVEKFKFFSFKTECKGQIFSRCSDLVQSYVDSAYIGLFDDDVIVRVSDINHMLFLANVLELDVFSPTLSHDSHHSHSFTLSQPGKLWREVPWVEVMAPWYRAKILKIGKNFFEQSISSWGIDLFAIPLLQKICSMQKTGVLDSVCVAHIRPITSWNRIYSNGKLALEEKWHLRDYCFEWIKQNNPSLLEDSYLMSIINSRKNRRQLMKQKIKFKLNSLLRR